MEATLRSAGETDSAAIADLFIASRRALVPFAPLAHSVEEIRSWVGKSMVPSGGVTVCERNGSIVGFAKVSVENGWVLIEHLYVSPQEVGKGIGSALLRHVLTTTQLPVRLHTFRDSLRARSFYERVGFVPVQFGDGSDNEEHCPDVLYELRRSSPAGSQDISGRGDQPGGGGGI